MAEIVRDTTQIEYFSQGEGKAFKVRMHKMRQ